MIPKGVFCLLSALAYYELTTYIPRKYHLALERTEKVTLPLYPPVRVYYWSRKVQQLGVVSNTLGGSIDTIHIYDQKKPFVMPLNTAGKWVRT